MPRPNAGRVDYVVCIVSTQNAPDPSIISLDTADVASGVLRKQSCLRPTYLFTTSESRIGRKVGVMEPGPIQAAFQALTVLFQP